MNHCLFPIKLYALLSKVTINDACLMSLNKQLIAPVDGFTRLPLHVPEVHQAFDGVLAGERYPRIRLAYNPGAILYTPHVELYFMNGAMGKLIEITDLTKEQALAIQAHLMYLLLGQANIYINPY